MMTEQHYRQNPIIPARDVGGVMAIITPNSSHIHRLNGIGAHIWHACEGEGATLGELVSVVVERYEVDENRANSDVARFLEEAVNKGLILTQ